MSSERIKSVSEHESVKKAKQFVGILVAAGISLYFINGILQSEITITSSA